MSHPGQRFDETRHRRNEAVVARHLRELFGRLPTLSGFWLDADMKVAKVVVTWIDDPAANALHDRVAESIAQIADECPEAVQLMRGRTFARAVH